jgi:hypothetical protein
MDELNKKLSDHRCKLDMLSKSIVSMNEKIEDAKIKLQNMPSTVNKSFHSRASYLDYIQYMQGENNRRFQGGFTEPAKRDFNAEVKRLEELMALSGPYYELTEQLEKDKKRLMEMYTLRNNEKEALSKVAEEATKFALKYTKFNNSKSIDWELFSL